MKSTTAAKLLWRGSRGGGGLFAFHAQMLQIVNCHLLLAALNHTKEIHESGISL